MGNTCFGNCSSLSVSQSKVLHLHWGRDWAGTRPCTLWLTGLAHLTDQSTKNRRLLRRFERAEPEDECAAAGSGEGPAPSSHPRSTPSRPRGARRWGGGKRRTVWKGPSICKCGGQLWRRKPLRAPHPQGSQPLFPTSFPIPPADFSPEQGDCHPQTRGPGALEQSPRGYVHPGK